MGFYQFTDRSVGLLFVWIFINHKQETSCMTKALKHSLIAAAVIAAAAAAQAETITLKVHHFLGPQSIQHTTMLGDWCKNIEKDSSGRLNC